MKRAYDIAIIGGGIVGLATAYKYLLRHPGKRLVLIEKEKEIASHQTGRNSGVIHSGIYYKPGSLKAQTCLSGYREIIDFCQTHDVAHEICGKIIVATSEDEIPRLKALHERGIQNGLSGLREIPGPEISDYEPHVAGLAALHVPQTGIIDYVGVCKALGQEIQQRGGTLLTGTKVEAFSETHATIRLETTTGDIEATQLCSCAGLHSDTLARQSDPKLDLRIIPFRGEYYELAPEKRHLVKNLIYPVPDPAFPFLGVHFTRMHDGSVEAGPNAVLALAREGYKWSDIDLADLADTLSWPGFWKLARKHWKMGGDEIARSLSKAAFTQALRRLIPEIQQSDITAAPSGVRAQACHRDGALLDDFYFHQKGRTLHVCNAPSPAATASLAIGESIVAQITASS